MPAGGLIGACCPGVVAPPPCLAICMAHSGPGR